MYGSFICIIFAVLAFFVGVPVLVVYFVKKKQNGGPPFDFRRLIAGMAITLILPFFIGFATSAVFDQLAKTESFVMMLVMAVIFLIIGLVIGHVSVLSTSFIIGSIALIVYAMSINIEHISAPVMAIIAGL